IITLTNAEKSEKYSNDVRSDLDLTAVLPTSLPALNETSSPAAPSSPSFTNIGEIQGETSSDDNSDGE
ncbi:MAG: hypothetical protein WBL67_04030, partial [Nitrososphaeraceae archaeon]